MRRSRLRAPEGSKFAYYHCVSRVVDRRFVFGPDEKSYFASLMRRCAEFCGVEVAAYCLMSNHFHILVGIPKPPQTAPSDEDLLLRLEKLGGRTGVDVLRHQLQEARVRADAGVVAELRGRLLRRLWNVSEFMKLVKQRFSVWFNRRHERTGTLWEERFRSVLVESAGNALSAMAAYIDLNPVRAGLVSHPREYRWCSYAQAVQGDELQRVSYEKIMLGYRDPKADVLELYSRLLLMVNKRGWVGSPPESEPDRATLLKTVEARRRVPLWAYLRCRVRYFCDGYVLGSREWVEEVFRARRSHFGVRRRSGARRMRGVEEAIYTARDLQLRVFA